MTLTPALILAMWTGGIAAGGALVAWWQVVGPGYLWLTGGVVAGFAVVTGLAGGGIWAYAAAAAAVAAVLVARRRIPATVVLLAAAAALLAAALVDSPFLPALSGLVFLGFITSEMMLGHWFLVDPRLPRWPLHSLDAVAGAGLLLDVGYVFSTGSVVFTGPDGVFGLTYVALAAFTGLLVAGVWFSLREPRYSGVMAATGLSYLAVLTAFGVVTLGRVLVTGGLP